jgi:hypothetical protein
VNAGQKFAYGSTFIPADKRDPNGRAVVTKTLNATLAPEEKRKIIGDMFVNVSLFINGLILKCITQFIKRQ